MPAVGSIFEKPKVSPPTFFQDPKGEHSACLVTHLIVVLPQTSWDALMDDTNAFLLEIQNYMWFGLVDSF